MTLEKKVGDKIKALRDAYQISLDELVVRTGIDKTQLEEIEGNHYLPALALLTKIARALGVRLGTLLDQETELGPVINRKKQEKRVIHFADRVQESAVLDFYSLAEQKSGRNMDPFLIDIEPNASEKQTFNSHEGEEFIFVLKGQLRIVYGTNDYVLNAGDSIYYDSIIEHSVEAATTEPAKVLAVVYTPV